MLAVAPPWTTAPSINPRRATPILPIAIGRPSSPPHRPLAKQPVNTPRQQTPRDEIPIASDAPHCSTSRGFLPWRFAYAGPRVRRATVMGRHPQTFTKTEVGPLQRHVRSSPDSRHCPASPACSKVPGTDNLKISAACALCLGGSVSAISSYATRWFNPPREVTEKILRKPDISHSKRQKKNRTATADKYVSRCVSRTESNLYRTPVK